MRPAVWKLSLSMLLVGCQGATGVMLEVSTDIPCESAKTVTTAIYAGSSVDHQSRSPAAVTTHCDPQGRIGSLVLVPSEDRSGALAIEVTTALAGKDPLTCAADASGCVVARRVLHYVPHEMLVLPVVMETACVGVSCGSNESCVGGRCVSPAVDPQLDPPDAGESADAGAGPDAPNVVADGGPAMDSATPPPPTCPASPPPGGAICCGTTWCVGAECASLCARCEAMRCESSVCDAQKMGKVSCRD